MKVIISCDHEVQPESGHTDCDMCRVKSKAALRAMTLPEGEKSISVKAYLYSREKWILFQSWSIIDGRNYI